MSDQSQTPQMPTPAPQLKALDAMVGTWKLTGRIVGAPEDNVKGKVTISWLPGGFFLEQRTDIEFVGMIHVQGVEIIGFDSAKQKLTSLVYPSMFGTAVPYEWEMDGRNLTVKMVGSATMHGQISEDGNTFTSSWRPDPGHENDPGNIAYDITGSRV